MTIRFLKCINDRENFNNHRKLTMLTIGNRYFVFMNVVSSKSEFAECWSLNNYGKLEARRRNRFEK